MEFVTIELRPRLQSCNVFISLLNNTDPSTIQVKLKKDFITLRVGKRWYNLCLATIRLIPTSLSSLRVVGSWVSFRIQTTPIDALYGSFGTELLGNSVSKNGSSLKSLSSTELPPKHVDLIFSCFCCENVVTNIINLEKVLPLPDDDCDPTDWFCCSHNGEDYSKLLEPRKSGYFYGPYFSILNRNNFTKELKINGESVVCNRCLTVIGAPNSDFSLKIWNCCIEYTEVNDASSILKKQANALADFKAAVRSSSDGHSNDRILLEAKGCGITRYLLLKPMEWNLELLVAPQELHDRNAIDLEVKKVVKVLYDYGEAKSTVKNDWLDAKHVQIGLRSMLAGMEHLISSSKRIPPIYRNADEHHIGYMNLELSDKT